MPHYRVSALHVIHYILANKIIDSLMIDHFAEMSENK